MSAAPTYMQLTGRRPVSHVFWSRAILDQHSDAASDDWIATLYYSTTAAAAAAQRDVADGANQSKVKNATDVSECHLNGSGVADWRQSYIKQRPECVCDILAERT